MAARYCRAEKGLAYLFIFSVLAVKLRAQRTKEPRLNESDEAGHQRRASPFLVSRLCMSQLLCPLRSQRLGPFFTSNTSAILTYNLDTSRAAPARPSPLSRTSLVHSSLDLPLFSLIFARSLDSPWIQQSTYRRISFVVSLSSPPQRRKEGVRASRQALRSLPVPQSHQPRLGRDRARFPVLQSHHQG